MSSSDSEDDCYGNVAKTLQNLKSKYQEDRLRSVNLLEGDKNTQASSEGDCIVIENTESSNANRCDLDKKLTEDEELDRIIELNTRRVTRASSSRNSTINNTTAKRKTRNSSRGGRKRKKFNDRNEEDVDITNESSILLVEDSNTTEASRVRNRRGRGRSVRKDRNISQVEGSWPIYSVGNTDDYPDQSDNLQLFSKVDKKQDEVTLDDTLGIDENEEFSVKVYWQNSEIVKFTIRKYQKLMQIFEFFSKKANVTTDKLLFVYNDKILKQDDTPDSIDYNIAKFIDGGIVNNSVMKIVELGTSETAPDDSGIKLKFQYPNSKKPFVIRIQKDDLLSMAMIKCAEHMEMPLKSLRFEFDGDSITGKDTAKDLDMEGGECIDVKIIR